MIDQHHPWSGVECAHARDVPAWRDNRHVPDPANVLEQAALVAARVQQRVGNWHERRTLAACGNVANTKIRYDVNARALRDYRGFTGLPRCAARGVPQRLTMRGDRTNLARVNVRILDDGERCGSKPLSQIERQCAIFLGGSVIHCRCESLALFSTV